MPKWLKIFLSGLLASLISGGGALVTALSAMPANTPFHKIGAMTWLVAVITGLTSAGKDWQAYLSSPPDGQNP